MLDRNTPHAGPRIEAFSGNGFRVDGVVHSSGLKLTPERAWDWAAPPIDALTPDDLADLIAAFPAPEFLLLGTGASLRRPSPGLLAAFEANGVGIEAMDSRAAARAWGMLRGEGREIIAALLPLG